MNHPQIQAEIHNIRMSNEAMFRLIKETKKEVEIVHARMNSLIDETNDISSINEIVSRIHKLENQLAMILSKKTNNEHNISLHIS